MLIVFFLFQEYGWSARPGADAVAVGAAGGADRRERPARGSAPFVSGQPSEGARKAGRLSKAAAVLDGHTKVNKNNKKKHFLSC